ncbi:hypothetical protein V2G26_020375 [Clonostachys chloroleuca]
MGQSFLKLARLTTAGGRGTPSRPRPIPLIDDGFFTLTFILQDAVLWGCRGVEVGGRPAVAVPRLSSPFLSLVHDHPFPKRAKLLSSSQLIVFLASARSTPSRMIPGGAPGSPSTTEKFKKYEVAFPAAPDIQRFNR